MPIAEETEYLKNNYGLCDAEPCACRRAHRALYGCPHWHPVAADTLEELADEMRRYHELDAAPFSI